VSRAIVADCEARAQLQSNQVETQLKQIELQIARSAQR
jgi:hypothetical protein